MEVACGEYGDMVPRLVVAVKANQCVNFQRHRKITNCEKGACYTVDGCAASVDAELSKMANLETMEKKDFKDLKETAILCDDEDIVEVQNDDGEEQIKLSRIVHNNQSSGAEMSSVEPFISSEILSPPAKMVRF